MILAVALSIGNVSFTLQPEDDSDNGSGDKKAASSLPPIVSVKKLKSKEGGDVVLAELSGFTGTLRIVQNKEGGEKDLARRFEQNNALFATQASKDKGIPMTEYADNEPKDLSTSKAEPHGEEYSENRAISPQNVASSSDITACLSNRENIGHKPGLPLVEVGSLCDSSQMTPPRPTLARGHRQNLNSLNTKPYIPTSMSYPQSTLLLDNEFSGPSYLVNAEKIPPSLEDNVRSSSFTSSLAQSSKIPQIGNESSTDLQSLQEPPSSLYSQPTRKITFASHPDVSKSRSGEEEIVMSDVSFTDEPVDKEPNKQMALEVDNNIFDSEAASNSNDLPPTPQITTPLHTACASSDVSIDELRALLHSQPEAASMADGNKRLPLHILSQNEGLLSDRMGRELASLFTWDLLNAFPLAPFEKDKNGYVPFTALLDQWVNDVHKRRSSENKYFEAESSTPYIYSLFSKLRSGNTCSQSHNNSATLSPPQTPQTSTSGIPSPKHSNDIDRLYRIIPVDVDITPIAEWSLNMLSAVLNCYRGALERDRFTRRQQLLRREELTVAVASIPSLLKVLLLIEDDDARNRVMDLSIVRRMVLCKHSVGRWLVHMLQHKGIPCCRVIDYFVLISNITIFDFIGKGRIPRQADFASFYEERDAVYDSVGSFSEMIPSLAVLSYKEMERASTTQIVWHILNESISRPFVISVIMIDFVLHIIFMATYRFITADYGQSISFDWVDFKEPNVPFLFISVISGYFLFRQLVQFISLGRISRKFLGSYLFSFWNMVDLSSVCFAIGSMVKLYEGEKVQAWILSVTMALLWLKLIGFLKAVNMELATFILSISQILRDIRWFLVVIAIAMITFSDMVHIVQTTANDGDLCDYAQNETITNDYCSPNLFKSYVRSYGILVGDIDIDDFRNTTFEAIVFIVFTFLAVIVLLNILIAVVCDSYEKSRVKAAHLFGRARVEFAAENASLEAFLRPTSREIRKTLMLGRPWNWRGKDWRHFLTKLGRLLVILYILAAAVFTDVLIILHLSGNEDTGAESIPSAFILYLLGILCLAILNVAIIVLIEFLVKNIWDLDAHMFALRSTDFVGRQKQKKIQKYATFIVRYIIRFISEQVLGIKHRSNLPSGDGEGEWNGRLHYLEQLTTRIVTEAEQNMQDAVNASENRIKEHETAIMTEIREGIGRCINKLENLP